MINVGKQDSITLKISHAMANTQVLDLDIYLFIPKELNANAQVLPEADFYLNSISQKRVYYSDKTLLPLVHSRLAKRGKLSSNQYRVSLSLFAYQYVIALDNAINKLNKQQGEDVKADDVDEVIELALDILKRLRRGIPFDENLKRYYVNIDNYLSWYTEQRFLSLIAHLPRQGEYKTIKSRLLTLCEREAAHRNLNRYNSIRVQDDMTRLSNKMRLLRRLIEHPIVLKEKHLSLGKNVKRAIKGGATGFIMIFVTITILLARDYLGEISASFILAMAFIYALREIFKDEFKDMLWKWIRRGKPRWRKQFYDPSTNQPVGKKDEWFDYALYDRLPDTIKTIRKRRVVQREESILHYHSKTVMATSHFMSGYEQTRETLCINFRSLMRLMDKGTNKVYKIKDGQVTRENVDKRHLINLVIKEDNHDGEPVYYRWKVILNRSKIVDIEQVPINVK
ncbi:MULTISPECIES: hypothetical protein [unclassified Vibrio]|uniref:Uncharacterized protein n=1 Tax=Vibrio sp. HB236076 TaxID=3232307 RepID=A0AB39HB27_9VIBR|nr:hypothetical protein [Vibrio sp. HB161653]MDP5253322.1 hypothetical protein [Vibrio sp. HB161653]